MKFERIKRKGVYENMEVTNVRLTKTSNVLMESKVKAYVTVTLDDCLVINDLRLIEGKEDKLFVAFPTRQARNGQRFGIVYPINDEMRMKITNAVIKTYNNN